MRRIVQCPRCRALLQEPPPGNPIYQCGSCSTTLQAKDSSNVDLGAAATRLVAGHETRNSLSESSGEISERGSDEYPHSAGGSPSWSPTRLSPRYRRKQMPQMFQQSEIAFDMDSAIGFLERNSSLLDRASSPQRQSPDNIASRVRRQLESSELRTHLSPQLEAHPRGSVRFRQLSSTRECSCNNSLYHAPLEPGIDEFAGLMDSNSNRQRESVHESVRAQLNDAVINGKEPKLAHRSRLHRLTAASDGHSKITNGRVDVEGQQPPEWNASAKQLPSEVGTFVSADVRSKLRWQRRDLEDAQQLSHLTRSASRMRVNDQSISDVSAFIVSQETSATGCEEGIWKHLHGVGNSNDDSGSWIGRHMELLEDVGQPLGYGRHSVHNDYAPALKNMQGLRSYRSSSFSSNSDIGAGVSSEVGRPIYDNNLSKKNDRCSFPHSQIWDGRDELDCSSVPSPVRQLSPPLSVGETHQFQHQQLQWVEKPAQTYSSGASQQNRVDSTQRTTPSPQQFLPQVPTRAYYVEPSPLHPSQISSYKTQLPVQQGPDFVGSVSNVPLKAGLYPPLPSPGTLPHVLCQHCGLTLAVPDNLPPSKKDTQKLRCGACSKVSVFSVPHVELSRPSAASFSRRVNHDHHHPGSPDCQLGIVPTIAGLNNSGKPVKVDAGLLVLAQDMLPGRPSIDLHSQLQVNSATGDAGRVPFHSVSGAAKAPRSNLDYEESISEATSKLAISSATALHSHKRSSDFAHGQSASRHSDATKDKEMVTMTITGDIQSALINNVRGLPHDLEVDDASQASFEQQEPYLSSPGFLEVDPHKGNYVSRSDSSFEQSGSKSPRQGCRSPLRFLRSPLRGSISSQQTLDSNLAKEHMQEQPRGINKALKGFINIKKSVMELTKGKQVQSINNYRRRVAVNGITLPDHLVKRAEQSAGPIHPGSYWYDVRAGFWGVSGGLCLGIIPPFIEEFNYPMSRDCANGKTGVLVNGRELHSKDLEVLARRGLSVKPGMSYSVGIDGKVVDEDSGLELKSLRSLAPSLEHKGQGHGMYMPSSVPVSAGLGSRNVP